LGLARLGMLIEQPRRIALRASNTFHSSTDSCRNPQEWTGILRNPQESSRNGQESSGIWQEWAGILRIPEE